MVPPPTRPAPLVSVSVRFVKVVAVKMLKRKLRSLYTAGGYDSTHRNPDGSYGATWVGYNQDPSQGYWVKGVVRQGTPM